MVKDKYGYLKGFALSGDDKVYRYSPAALNEDGSVTVSHSAIKNPKFVRYGWANNPEDLNLFNKEGLPAVPFRTDDWPGITKK